MELCDVFRGSQSWREKCVGRGLEKNKCDEYVEDSGVHDGIDEVTNDVKNLQYDG